RIFLDELVQDGPLPFISTNTVTGAVQVQGDLAAEFDTTNTTVPFTIDYVLATGAPTVTVDTAALQNFAVTVASQLADQAVDAGVAAGVAQIDAWTDTLATYLEQADILNRDLPILGESVNDLLVPADILQGISDALTGAITNGLTPANFASAVDSAFTALEGSEPTLTGVDFSVGGGSSAGGFSALTDAAATALGFDSAGDRYLFDLPVNFTKTLLDQTVNFTGTDDVAGLAITANVDIVLDGMLDLTFGIDRNAGLDPATAFFLRINDFELGLMATIGGNADLDVGAGLVAASVTNASLALDARLRLGIGAPVDQPRFLTVTDLLGISASGAVEAEVVTSTLTGGADLDVSLPGGGSLTTALSLAGDPLAGSFDVDLTGGDPTAFLDFSDVTASSVVATLRQVTSFLSSLTDADFFDQDLPLVDVSLGELLDYGQAFIDDVESVLQGTDGTPTFTDIDGYIAALEATPAFDVGDVGVEYLTATRELLFTLSLDHTFAPIPDGGFEFDIDVSPLGGVFGTGTFSLTGSTTLDVGVALALAGGRAEMIAARGAVTNGRPGDDARFQIITDDERTINVLVPVSATAANNSLSALVVDVRDALRSGLVEAGFASNAIDVTTRFVNGATRLVFVAAEDGPTGFTVIADAEDAAVTGLGIGDPAVLQPVLSAEAPLPSDGVLASPASFDVSVGGMFVGSVSVPAVTPDVPDDNLQPGSSGVGTAANAIVSAINAALSPINTAISSGQIIATLGAAGELQLVGSGGLGAFSVTAQAGNPAVTVLGLPASGAAAQTTVLQISDTNVADAIRFTDLDATASFAATGTFDAVANFGVVELAVTGANASLSGGVSFGLSPASVSLGQLFDGLDNPTSIFGASLQFTGTGSATAPVAVTGPLATLIGLSGTASFDLSASDIFTPTTWTADFANASQLLDFDGIDADDLGRALQALVDAVRNLATNTFLNVEIPLIDVRISDVLDVVDRLAADAQALIDQGVPSLNAFEQILQDLIANITGLSGDVVTLSWDNVLKDLRFDVTYAPNIASQTLGFNFDLDSLGLGAIANLPGIGGLVEVGGNGELTVSPSFSALLSFGFTLTNPASPQLYIHRDTGVTAGLRVATTQPLNLKVGGGPFTIEIANGSVAFDATGASTAPATFTVGVIDTQERWNPASIFAGNNFRSFFDATLDGEIVASLPLVVGGSPQGALDFEVRDLQTFIDRIFRGVSTTALFNGTNPDFVLNVPDLSTVFDNLDLLGSGDDFVDNIILFLEVLEDVLDGKVFGIELPFVGDNLADAADFVGEIRMALDTANALRGASGIDAARQALFDLFTSPAFDLLQDITGDGMVTLADMRVNLIRETGQSRVDYDGLTTAERDAIDLLDVQDIDFDFTLGGTWGTGIDVAFELGLPALSLSISEGSSLQGTIDWTLDTGFGIDRTNGFYINTFGEDLDVTPTFGLSEGFQVVGQLGFLQLLISQTTGSSTGLTGNVGVDLDGISAGTGLEKLYIQNFGTAFANSDIDFNLSAGANLDLQFGGGFNFNETTQRFEEISAFPSIEGELVINYPIIGTTATGGAAPEVRFDNLRLDLGSFARDLLGPVFDPISAFLEPLDPLLDFFNAPIPGISDLAGRSITPIDLARLYAQGGQYEGFVSFLDSLSELAQLLGFVSEFSSNDLDIPLGSLNFGSLDLRDPNALAPSTVDNLSLDQLASRLGATLNSADDIRGSVASAGGSAAMFSSGFGDDGGFSFPILDNPASILGMLFGRNVDLIRYDMPTFNLGFGIPSIFLGATAIGPVPVTFYLGGSLGLEIDLTFGFDTFGLAQFASSPPESRSFGDIFNGFYILDTDTPGGEDPLEIALRARVQLEAAAGIRGLAAIGVNGGVEAEIGFNINDVPDPETMQEDGRLRWPEVIQRLGEGSPLCIFDVGGALRLFFEAFVEILFVFKGTLPITPPITIASFEVDLCGDPPELAELMDDGTLVLNVGDRAALRDVGVGAAGTRTADITAEDYVLTELGGGIVRIDAFGVTRVYGNPDDGFVERIVGDAGTDDDSIIVDGPLRDRLGNALTLDLIGGSGNDVPDPETMQEDG
ncbi:MAG: hypothetical protein AAFR52_03765, partial [Pseudomonadota bacterium]